MIRQPSFEKVILMAMTNKLEAVLIDLSGVVYVGDEPVPGSLDAIASLREREIGVRFITNTTRLPHERLLEKLRRIGLKVDEDDVFTPGRAARSYLQENDLEPHLLVHPDLEVDFEDITGSAGKAVIIGDAAEDFTYANLDRAYQALDDGARFVALARNRNFRGSDDRLHLDAGPFVAALEYALDEEALVLGKPSRDFFGAALDSLGAGAANAAMIGDDVESDVGGAMAAGLTGVLVQTGKYESGAEERIDPRPDHVAADLAEAVQWLIDR